MIYGREDDEEFKTAISLLMETSSSLDLLTRGHLRADHPYYEVLSRVKAFLPRDCRPKTLMEVFKDDQGATTIIFSEEDPE